MTDLDTLPLGPASHMPSRYRVKPLTLEQIDALTLEQIAATLHEPLADYDFVEQSARPTPHGWSSLLKWQMWFLRYRCADDRHPTLAHQPRLVSERVVNDNLTFAEAVAAATLEVEARHDHTYTTVVLSDYDPVMGAGLRRLEHTCNCGHSHITETRRYWTGD
jgi:hypothetical protein